MVFVNCIQNLSILCKYAGHLYTHGAFYLNPLKKKKEGALTSQHSYEAGKSFHKRIISPITDIQAPPG